MIVNHDLATVFIMIIIGCFVNHFGVDIINIRLLMGFGVLIVVVIRRYIVCCGFFNHFNYFAGFGLRNLLRLSPG